MILHPEIVLPALLVIFIGIRRSSRTWSQLKFLIQLPVEALQKIKSEQCLDVIRLAIQRFADIHVPQTDRMALKQEPEAPDIRAYRMLCGADPDGFRLMPFHVRQPGMPECAEGRTGMTGIDSGLEALACTHWKSDGSLLDIGVGRRGGAVRCAD